MAEEETRGSKETRKLWDQSFRVTGIPEMSRETERNYAIISIRIFDFSGSVNLVPSRLGSRWQVAARATFIRIITYVWLNIIIGSRPRLAVEKRRPSRAAINVAITWTFVGSWLIYARWRGRSWFFRSQTRFCSEIAFSSVAKFVARRVRDSSLLEPVICYLQLKRVGINVSALCARTYTRASWIRYNK